MSVKYLIRLDDACPCMFHERWNRIEEILDEYGVKPLVGIIPANADPDTMKWQEDGHFWEKAINWEKKGWEIALHGYDHVCISNEGLNGLNPVWARSEFAGVPLEEQRRKIAMGGAILKEHGLHPKYFFAPSHTFDINTLESLRQETDIRIVSDTYSLKPYKRYEFTFIPCQLGHPKEMKLPGVYTICLHPNNMDDEAIKQFEVFLKVHDKETKSFKDIDFEILDSIRLIDRLVQMFYFTNRRLKGFK